MEKSKINKYLVKEVDTFPEAFPVEFSKKVRLEIESIKELKRIIKRLFLFDMVL